MGRSKIKKKKNIKHEAILMRQFIAYVRSQYPKAIVIPDVASGMPMTIGQAKQAAALRSSRALPDLFIARANKNSHGLFIELKKQGTRIQLRNGTLTADKHIQEQAKILSQLRAEGYYAEFGIGFDNCKAIADDYFNN